MNKEALDSLKESLELDEAFKVGRFGVFLDSSDAREEKYYIKANKEGLKLFAYQLLCVSKDFEDQEKENSFERIELVQDTWVYKHSEIILNYIEPPQMSIEADSKVVKETWKDWLGKIGCILLVVFLLISLVVGVITLFTYL